MERGIYLLSHYHPTVLEDWVESKYRSVGIFTPAELTIENVAAAFDIRVFQLPGAKEEALWDDRVAAIFLDADKPPIVTREVFFHELCHPLLHHGDQLGMSTDQRLHQEEQASHFQLYAALPFFMIRVFALPQLEVDIIHLLATEFGVTHGLAQKRWEQIHRRVYTAHSHYQLVAEMRNKYKKSQPANWSDETKALYDLAIQRKQRKYRGTLIR
jgi:Zn-dependent peptidase ImmA (M78 family)